MVHLGLPFSAIPRTMPMRLDTNLVTALGSELMRNVARRQFSRTLLMLLLMQCSAMPSFAQERAVSGADAQIGVPVWLSRSAVDGDVLANARGRVSINVSAGFVNAQSNNAALAASSGSANAVATANVRVDAVPGMPGNSSALIAGNAFAGAAGMLSGQSGERQRKCTGQRHCDRHRRGRRCARGERPFEHCVRHRAGECIPRHYT